MSKFCYPITVPKDDAYGSKLGIECENFVRTLTDVDLGCDCAKDKGYAEQVSVATAFLDLSNVYGCYLEDSNKLRSFCGGHLQSDVRGDQELLPASLNKCDQCFIDDSDEDCFRSGDTRVNQNPGLVVLATIWLREHNRVADGLKKVNPHWSDEKLFQEARRITIAEFQQITFYEWMPILLGNLDIITIYL